MLRLTCRRPCRVQSSQRRVYLAQECGCCRPIRCGVLCDNLELGDTLGNFLKPDMCGRGSDTLNPSSSYSKHWPGFQSLAPALLFSLTPSLPYILAFHVCLSILYELAPTTSLCHLFHQDVFLPELGWAGASEATNGITIESERCMS